ncbi:type II secretion system protein GspC [Pseudohaliea rubra]|uniref:General secretion pathway protein C n=1 Tax=Pseudohaliea rubra DSM 19751 TaxID=1265313 RepID=A0A095VVI9_9GAMM|nr:type II secretion system protein GspC [Pseudohaliea rubra]KGE05380.1 General secretion pathway protein C [Pseudohaliea rubra DSM 19751]
MPQTWRETLTAGLAGVGQRGQAVVLYWARPERLRRLQQALLVLLAAWVCFSLARLGWSFLPTPTAPMPPASALVNPASRAAAPAAGPAVDIEAAVSWHLFGEAGALTEEALAELAQQQATTAKPKAGIEDGARETRLALTLTGIVATDEDGLGFAMIEHRGAQQVYAVGDELPVGGRVVLAKVLPQRVVLDNGGTYELLTLFEASELGAQLAGAAPSTTPARAPAPAGEAPERETLSVAPRASGLATQYRERLYNDPQSLADVVRITAVRQDDQLVGYRVSPGRASEDFAALGFEPGDIVTGVNGLALTDPANTVRLYQAMREAREAVFDLTRDGEALSLSVRLAAAGDTD